MTLDIFVLSFSGMNGASCNALSINFQMYIPLRAVLLTKFNENLLFPFI